MNSQIYLYEIRKYLAWFTSHITLENESGYFDINKYSEKFLIPILNYIFNTKFERLEFDKKNYPAIDIGSKELKISFQITASTGYEKIKNTLTSYIVNEVYKEFPVLFHLIINENYETSKTNADLETHISNEIDRVGVKPKPTILFKKDEHIWNIANLLKNIEQKCDSDKLKLIRDHFEKEYGKVTALPTFDDILIPYEIAFRQQLDSSNENLPAQFHTPFYGRKSDSEKLQKFVEESTTSVIAVVGDGGYGKTRLVVELFKQLAANQNGTETYVLNEAAFQCLDFATQIRTDKKVIVLFDDAHRKPEILNDLIGVANRLENLKLILTVRKAVYSDTLKSISTHNRSIESVELLRLSYEETQSLFKSQLSFLEEYEIKKLAEESKGVPVVILGLCSITLKGKYKSELSEEANFMLFVNEAKEQVINDIHSKYFISKESINKTIQLISYFGPIKNSPDEIQSIATLNGIASDETSIIIDYLQEYGFVEKKTEITIKPDPYSDAILLESAPRIKYLLQKGISIFLDRLIRNLVEVEKSSRIDFSIESLITDFITSFKSKDLNSRKSIADLENNLETLKTFTYKKPRLCFLAIRYLLQSQAQNPEFWQKEETFALYSKSFKSVHDNIEVILSIATLNTHDISELDEIYDLLLFYKSKKLDNIIFSKIFRYRVYDFYEYRYNPPSPCERQTYLVKKLKKIIEKGDLEKENLDHILSCCKTLLTLEFEAESYFDKYTHSFTYGRAYVIPNKTTKSIREDTLSILCQVYMKIRYTKDSELYFQEILRPLFFTAETKRNEYIYPQEQEVIIISEFLRTILDQKPNIFERSSILKQLKLFERKEIKDEYKDLIRELLSLSENVSTSKEKLELLFLDDYFSLKNNIDRVIKEIIEGYTEENLFFNDIIEIKINLSDRDYTNFSEIINHLSISNPELSRRMLQYIIEHYPDQSCSFAPLIRGNYSDDEYFYETLNRIWNLDYECAKAAVIWMLTHGRNQNIELYRDDDLKYIEYVIENKILSAIGHTPFTLAKYILINPERTINIISKILKLGGNVREDGFLLHSIFENKEIIQKHSDLIKEFVFKDTIEFPIESHYIEDILTFLESRYGFDTMFAYLIRKTEFYESKEEFLALTLYKHYNNPHKDQIPQEIDFLKVIAWYTGLKVKSRYFHRRLLEFLRPSSLQSEEFKDGFKTIISKANDKKEMIIEICNTLDVYENKGEYIIALLIEIANELCDKLQITREDLINIFGTNFIYNMGIKTGFPGQPFPEDIRGRDLFISILEKYELHPQVKDLFLFAIKNIENDIARERITGLEDAW